MNAQFYKLWAATTTSSLGEGLGLAGAIVIGLALVVIPHVSNRAVQLTREQLTIQ